MAYLCASLPSTVSVVDFVATVRKETTKEAINAAFKVGCRWSAQWYPRISLMSRWSRAIFAVTLTHPSLMGFDDGHGRQHGQGRGMVRQRVGLFLPRRRPCRISSLKKGFISVPGVI